tara:strand:- start:626 stop:1819 length:1194 start_codon:yes stop_codon:yes gene_type:complete
MNLKQFLQFKRITQLDFAKKLNISPISLSRYIGKERLPEKNILLKIYNLTDGLVSPNDFYLNNETQMQLGFNKIKEIKNLAKNIKLGKRKYLGKAITMIESSLEEDQQATQFLLNQFKRNDNSIRIGITGVPGVGKSTFIESLGLKLINEGLRVAVLAIDPSSKKSGGSILGDKTRMERLSVNPNAFIRPSPSDGHLGGVAKKTSESILCLEESNFDVIFVETMGVGQAETAVYDMVDIFLLLLLPSGGDELQGIKKGIIELANLIIVNKADNGLKKQAEITQREYINAINIKNNSRKEEKIDVLTCSSLESKGFEKIWKYIKKFVELRKKNQKFFQNRQSQRSKWMWNAVNLKTRDYIQKDLKFRTFTKKIQNDVEKNLLGIVEASDIILSFITKK